MPGIDENLLFHPLRIAVLTISDTRTRDNDTSGDLLVSRVEEAGHLLADRALVLDSVQLIRERVLTWIEDQNVDVVITTGGTGFTQRDNTPEAIKPLFRREMDGFSILFHMASFATVGISTLQSRAFAGQLEGAFVFCLPGSPGACRDGWDKVLALELDSRYRPCSIVAHIPQFKDLFE